MRLQLLQNGDLSHGSRWYSLVIILQFYLLECHSPVMNCVTSLEDDTVSAFTNALHALVLLPAVQH